MADVERLETKTTGLTYQPEELANGANGLLDEVSASKITGEEDRYSHTDLSDFEANVAGLRDRVRPARAGAEGQDDPQLATTIAARFDAVNAELDKLKQGDALPELRHGRQGRAQAPEPAGQRAGRAAVEGRVAAVASPRSGQATSRRPSRSRRPRRSCGAALGSASPAAV